MDSLKAKTTSNLEDENKVERIVFIKLKPMSSKREPATIHYSKIIMYVKTVHVFDGNLGT